MLRRLQELTTALLKWLRCSRSEPARDAQTELGFMYYNGEGVSQDYQEARKWCRLAAEHGNAFHEVWMSRGAWLGWLSFGGTIFFQLLVRDMIKTVRKLTAAKRAAREEAQHANA